MLALFIQSIAVADATCETWFIKSEAVPGSDDCVLTCSTSIVDMGTFSCPNDCENLCSSTLPDIVVTAVGYKKGITEGDKKLIAKYPLDALKVYREKLRAEELTFKIFQRESTNDESDAFRHFVWAGLLVTNLNEERAKLFLAAHEQDPTAKKNESEMDSRNNQQGFEFASQRKKSNITTELDDLEKEALNRLRQKKLIVLEPSGKKVPSGYYSN